MMAASPEALRRGWCPSTLRPMETGDGWLVRLHPPGARSRRGSWSVIAALAERFGNGLIEISARANLQLRGVTEATHPALVAALLRERLVDEHDGEGPQRLVLTSPLLDLARAKAELGFGDHVDAAALARRIDAAGREADRAAGQVRDRGRWWRARWRSTPYRPICGWSGSRGESGPHGPAARAVVRPVRSRGCRLRPP